MKKLVNGKVVDIRNINLFELGFEGIAMRKLVTSNINNELDGEPTIVKECVEEYNNIYKSLPFPLYAVESNIKYAAMATYIQDRVATKLNIPVDMWVDNGIYVPLADKKALMIVGNTWGIVTSYNAKKYTKLTDEQVQSTNIETYRHEDGYDEFKWCLIQLMEEKSLRDFYKKFIRGFEEACMGEQMVMKWELSRLLDFGHIPEKENVDDNIIKNIMSGKMYQIDIFWTGRMRKAQNGENIMVIDLANSKNACEIKAREEKEYNYEMYELNSNSARRKLKNEKLAFSGLLQTIVQIGRDSDRVERVSYRGITDGDIVAFSIEGSVYVGNIGQPLTIIGSGIELWGIEGSKVYMKKEAKKETGVTRVCYYAYEVKTEKLKICKIEYK